MQYSNFANHAALRQALQRQFEIFAGIASCGFFRGPAIPSGQPVAINGVPSASYTLSLDPHQPEGVCGHLDAGMLRWASGGSYREAPLMLSTHAEWRFLPSVRLRSRRDVAEARIISVRPVSLAAGGRPEALASAQIVVESRLGQHMRLLPCVGGTVPPACGRLEPGGSVLLALRRFGIGAAAVVGVLSIDQVGVALNNVQEVAA